MLVGSYDGRVDHCVFIVRIVCQGLEKTLPNTAHRPAGQTLVRIAPAAKTFRKSRHGVPTRNFQITASLKRRCPFSVASYLPDDPLAKLNRAIRYPATWPSHEKAIADLLLKLADECDRGLLCTAEWRSAVLSNTPSRIL